MQSSSNLLFDYFYPLAHSFCYFTYLVTLHSSKTKTNADSIFSSKAIHSRKNCSSVVTGGKHKVTVFPRSTVSSSLLLYGTIIEESSSQDSIKVSVADVFHTDHVIGPAFLQISSFRPGNYDRDQI